MDRDRVLAHNLWPITQRLEAFKPTFTEAFGLAPFFEFLHRARATAMRAHPVGQHLTRLKIAGGVARDRPHHAAAHIGHHRRELSKGVVAHLFHITAAHQGRFDALNAIAQFGQWKGLTVVKPLTIPPRHRHGGCLIKTLIQQQGEEGRQHTGVVLMKGVAKASKDRRHVFGCLDVLPLHVVDAWGDLNVGRQTIEHPSPQQRR